MADQLGTHAFRLADYRSAIRHFSDSLLSQGERCPVLLNRSAAYLKLGKCRAALADASRAAELEPENAKCWFRQGQAWLGMGEFDEAVGAFARGVELVRGGGGEGGESQQLRQMEVALKHAEAASRAAKEAAMTVTFRCRFQKEERELTVPNTSGEALLQAVAKQMMIDERKFLLVTKGKQVSAANAGELIRAGCVAQVFGIKKEDETGCDERDIVILMEQVGLHRNDAVRALRANGFDVISAIASSG